MKKILFILILLSPVFCFSNSAPDQDYYGKNIIEYNPDKYPSLGLSYGSDRFNTPSKYRNNLMSIDGRWPVSPWTTVYGEAGMLKITDGDQSSSGGQHYKAGIRWYFHK